MTSLITLLTPAGAAEPAPQPAPAEDAALFAAALVAALQSAAVPVPREPPPASASTLPREPASGDEPAAQEGRGTESAAAGPIGVEGGSLSQAVVGEHPPALPAAARPAADRPAATPVEQRGEAGSPEGEPRVSKRKAESRGAPQGAPAASAPVSQPVIASGLAAMGTPLPTPPLPTPAPPARTAPPASRANPAEPRAVPRASDLTPAAEVLSGTAPEAGTPRPAPGDAERGLALVRDLDRLSGGAAITGLQVSVGRRERAPEGVAPGMTPAPADATTGGGSTVPATGSPAPAGTPPLGPPAVAAGVLKPSRPEAAPGATGHAGVTGRDEDRIAVRGEVAPPSLGAALVGPPESVPRRAAPRSISNDQPRPARAAATPRAPILPVPRQELPPSAGHDNPRAAVAPGSERPEAREPSDSQAGVSATVPGPGEPRGRSEVRAKEAAGGEARNMPDRGETPERPAGVADRVTLRIADADGRQTRIRVTVLGDQVRAVILPSDPESGRQLERRMDDLQAALVSQGFAPPKVTVRSPAVADAAVPWGGSSPDPPNGNGIDRGREQPAEDRGQGSGRQEQHRHEDGQRHPRQRFRERDRGDRQNEET